MLSLLKSLGILWPPKGPPAGSEKQPREAKPRIAEIVEVDLEVVREVEVVVMRVVDEAAPEVGEVVGADEEVEVDWVDNGDVVVVL
jgi:hypothetical protein